ncbi:MAG: Mur ligase family protein [Kiritimatiellae bacterium]|jgi:UDP-N-acetylmuramate--alanine ligase|nr:Mur ligase family protein [Kiritimatiellia bacterium]
MKDCRLHFGGVAGIGMSALAQAMTTAGCKVTGSDRIFDQSNDADWQKKTCTSLRIQLSNYSVEVTAQDGSAISKDINALVLSTAIEDTNPEVVRAKELGIPVLHRSEILDWYLAGFNQTVAISGTCGKSSVTGMLGWILEYCGTSPTVVNGAPVINWIDELNIGNFRCGKDSICIFEADESDKSLLRYKPDISVITNISADHFSKSEAVQVFDEFRSNTKEAVFDMYSLDDVKISKLNSKQTKFRYMDVDFELKVIGEHNIENALYAIEVALYLGCGINEISEALLLFKGISKRLENVGKTESGADVILDFAHNPKKIKASLETVKSDNGSLFVVWRPHGYAPLRSMFDSLVESFVFGCKDKDNLFLLPVYDVGGTADRNINSDVLCKKLEKYISVSVGEYEDFRDEILENAKDGDVIVVMGARDPYLEVFARGLTVKSINN